MRNSEAQNLDSLLRSMRKTIAAAPALSGVRGFMLFR